MSEPIRVLQVVGNMDAGGLETMIMNWYRKIDRDKVQFDFLVHNLKQGFYEEEIKSLGANVYHCTVLDDWNFIKYKKFLTNFFENHKEYRIVHGHHSALGAFYLKAAKAAGIPIRISHSHIASFSKSVRGCAKFFITRQYGKYASVHFACSKAAGEYMYGKNGKYIVINNGIDTDKFRFDPEIRDEYRANNELLDKMVLIHVGRFHDQKNHQFLIDVFNAVQKRNEKSVLLLLGVGPLQESIRCKVNGLGLSEKVLFLNNRDDVNCFLSAADVFVFPSLYEGLPLTLVEAQTSGLPVVCSDRITEETKLSENYYSLSLNAPVSEWADLIIQQGRKENHRSNSYLAIRQKHYDSTDVVTKMEKYYLKVSNSNS